MLAGGREPGPRQPADAGFTVTCVLARSGRDEASGPSKHAAPEGQLLLHGHVFVPRGHVVSRLRARPGSGAGTCLRPPPMCRLLLRPRPLPVRSRGPHVSARQRRAAVPREPGQGDGAQRPISLILTPVTLSRTLQIKRSISQKPVVQEHAQWAHIQWMGDPAPWWPEGMRLRADPGGRSTELHMGKRHGGGGDRGCGSPKLACESPKLSSAEEQSHNPWGAPRLLRDPPPPAMLRAGRGHRLGAQGMAGR